MNRRALLALLCLALACPACTNIRKRGELAAVSTRAKDLPVQIIAENATGKTCRPPHQLDLAVADALANAPTANALMNAKFTVHGACLEVRGTAVRTR